MQKTFTQFPAYQRIEEDMRSRIRSGDWPVGAMIKSRKKLAQDYQVSLMTLERAVNNLLTEGILQTDGRMGTFVAPPDTKPNLSSLRAITDQITRRTPLSNATNSRLGIVAACQYTAQTERTADMMIRPIINSLERVFSNAGGTTRLFNRYKAMQPVVPVADAIEALLNAGIDALVIVDYHNDLHPDDPVYTRLQDFKLPLVVVSAREISRPVPHIFMDNVSAGYQAAQHLIDVGCRKITILAPFRADWLDERIVGIQNALAHSNLLRSSLHLYPGGDLPAKNDIPAEDGGYRAGLRLFESSIAIDGVIAATDLTAYGFLRAAAESRRSAGVDFALVGFDDAAASPDIGLTSVRPPFEALGEEAAHLIHRALNGQTLPMQVRLNGHLLVRQSTQICAVA